MTWISNIYFVNMLRQHSVYIYCIGIYRIPMDTPHCTAQWILRTALHNEGLSNTKARLQLIISAVENLSRAHTLKIAPDSTRSGWSPASD